MATIDVHRMLDDMLPGKKVESVRITHCYFVTVDGEELAAQFEPDERPDRIAQYFASQATPAADNAEQEGTEHPEEPSESEPEHETHARSHSKPHRRK